MKQLQEEIIVLFHASLIGRADVVQNAISSIRAAGKLSDKEVAAAVSTGRAEDSATPLHIAAHYGHTDVIRSLLNAGADLSFAPLIGEYADRKPYDLASDASKETFHVYMFEQIAMNNSEAIERLIDGGIPADTRDDSPVRDSTLHWAASFGSEKVATVLLLNGCNVDITNEEGCTPLHLACKGNHAGVIALLLDEGASAVATDAAGRSPKDLLPASASPETLALLSNPPSPSKKLHAAFQKAQEEKAAQAQLLLQQRLLQKQRSNSLQSNADYGAGVHDIDDSDLGLGAAATVSDEKELLLIFWPPVKRQQRTKNAPPLVLRNNSNLLVSVASGEIDMIPLMTWSGLMDLMDAYGFQMQIKRSSAGAKIRLCLDRNICPVNGSYELKVAAEQIFLTAGDTAGLMYGIYTLIQLFKLHSEIAVDDQTGVLTLSVPSIAITDRPDVAQRAVLWSYRQQARTASSRMQEQVELLARLRINTLFLVVDPVDSREDTEAMGHHGGHRQTGKLSSQEVTSTKVYALDEKCRRHCIDLVPTLIVQSVHQRLPLDVLKNFSHSMLSLVLVFDKHSVAAELAADHPSQQGESTVDMASVAAACITACERIVKDAHLAGCSTLSLACSEWVRQVADPVGMAIGAGLNAVERDFSVMYPSSLFTKPLLCVQDYVQSLSNYATKVEEACSSVSVFPAFMDRDFMYPALFLKFYCFMYGGLAWNRASLFDMLGDPASPLFDANIVREAMYLLMFPAKVELPQATFQVVMDLITGVTNAAEMRGESSSSAIERTGSDANLTNGDALSPPPSGGAPTTGVATAQLDLARAEKLLWSLLTARDGLSAAAVPSKAESAACLRVYRKILHNAHWKPDTLANKQATTSSLLSFMSGNKGAAFSGDVDESAHDSHGANGVETTPAVVLEVEEIFCTLNLLSALCKALVLAHKTHEKRSTASIGDIGSDINPAPLVSFEELFESVAVGTKSDFANSILECLSGCAFLWRRRFEASLLTALKSANLLLLKPANDASGRHVGRTSSGNIVSTRALVAFTIKEANRRYLLQDTPLIPAAAVFRLLTKNIPLPRSVQDFIQRLFSR